MKGACTLASGTVSVKGLTPALTNYPREHGGPRARALGQRLPAWLRTLHQRLRARTSE